jgi:hypothetical protein
MPVGVFGILGNSRTPERSGILGTVWGFLGILGDVGRLWAILGGFDGLGLSGLGGIFGIPRTE